MLIIHINLTKIIFLIKCLLNNHLGPPLPQETIRVNMTVVWIIYQVNNVICLATLESENVACICGALVIYYCLLLLVI